MVTSIDNNQLTQALCTLFSQVQGDWKNVADSFIASPAGQALSDFVDAEVARAAVVYPAHPLWVLTLTPLEQVRVVILGQDPYHGPGQAQGLAFSVPDGMKLPPSLRNIFKEQQRDLGIVPPASGSLVRWAEQGVLLLNTTLTVRQSEPASHAKKGWEIFTDMLIEAVASQGNPKAFLLWGAHAQAKEGLIQVAAQKAGLTHAVFKSNHPSPLSATKPPVPFIGCGHFSAANDFLKQNALAPIVW